MGAFSLWVLIPQYLKSHLLTPTHLLFIPFPTLEMLSPPPPHTPHLSPSTIYPISIGLLTSGLPPFECHYLLAVHCHLYTYCNSFQPAHSFILLQKSSSRNTNTFIPCVNSSGLQCKLPHGPVCTSQAHPPPRLPGAVYHQIPALSCLISGCT